MTFRLLKLVRDPNTGDAEIEEVLRRDVALSYKLLRMVNSAAVGGRDIWSIGHALRLLGRDQVARWLGLLLVTDGAQERRSRRVDEPLARARADVRAPGRGVGDSARARSALSRWNAVGARSASRGPMETLAESMELAPDVREALLHRGDFYGAVLGLVEAYEQGFGDESTC